MSPYFKKLSLMLDVASVNKEVDLLRGHGAYTAWQKYGIAYKRRVDFNAATNASYHLDERDKLQIVQQLPKGLLEVEVPDVWLLHAKAESYEGRVMLPPHVDGVRQCSINVYFKTNGEKTAYYEYRNGGNIDEVASFVAQPGDVYLLNSDKPHSVEVNGEPRQSVSISFITTPYEVVERFFLEADA